MGEREEKLIQKIIIMQKEQNSLKLDEQIENYQKDIKEACKIIEKTKNEIERLKSQLDDLKNKNGNDNSENEQNIENKKNELNKILAINDMKKKQLESFGKRNENFNNQDYIWERIKFWGPQTMIKFIQLYDKK